MVLPVIFQNYAKMKVDSYEPLPLEKKKTFHDVIILIKSVFNKNKNNYYYNVLNGNLLTSLVLVLTAAVVAKLEILCIPCLISFILPLRAVLGAKFMISGTLSAVSLILAFTSFLALSFFTTLALFLIY